MNAKGFPVVLFVDNLPMQDPRGRYMRAVAMGFVDREESEGHLSSRARALADHGFTVAGFSSGSG
jgi:hypothetical protein